MSAMTECEKYKEYYDDYVIMHDENNKVKGGLRNTCYDIIEI